MRDALVFKVSFSEKGMRLVFFLKKKTNTALSNRDIKKALEKGVCKLNNRIENFASVKLKAGDVVELQKKWHDSLETSLSSPKILYEDDYLVIINKEAGFTCSDIDLHKFFPHNYLLVHRLDRDTSGALIIAKSLNLKDKMIKLFSTKDVKKTYIAVVDGEVKEKKGRISSFLEKKNFKGKILYQSSDKKGEYALTLFDTLKARKEFSVLKCYPITGRTHQIRVHMLQIKHPILGDYQYFQNFKYPFFLKRLMLHSLQVEFDHPMLEKKVIVEAPLPSVFKKFWEK